MPAPRVRDMEMEVLRYRPGLSGSEYMYIPRTGGSLSGLDGRIEEKQVRFYGSRRGRLCYVGAGRKTKKEILACTIGKDDLMPALLNHRGLYRLPWTLPDNAISWLEPTSA